MEVSEIKIEPNGQELINTLIDLSGLPDGLIRPEVHGILDRSVENQSELTLDQLREAMMAYLEKIHQDFLESEAQD